jgi:hypothetical protein
MDNCADPRGKLKYICMESRNMGFGRGRMIGDMLGTRTSRQVRYFSLTKAGKTPPISHTHHQLAPTTHNRHHLVGTTVDMPFQIGNVVNELKSTRHKLLLMHAYLSVSNDCRHTKLCDIIKVIVTGLCRDPACATYHTSCIWRC